MLSVRVVSPDWAAVEGRLARWADEFVHADPTVLGVALFGSLARGDHAPGSDADLLVVVSSSPHPPRERADHLPPLRLPICHQAIVYSAGELARLAAAGQPFVRRVLAEARWLARQPGWSLPAAVTT